MFLSLSGYSYLATLQIPKRDGELKQHHMTTELLYDNSELFFFTEFRRCDKSKVTFKD